MTLMTQTIKRAIVDSSILIGFFHNDQRAAKILNQLNDEEIHPCISVITAVELLAGIVSLKHQQQTTDLLNDFEWIAFNSMMAELSGKLLLAFKNDKQKRSSSFPDALIAATAEYYQMDIYTGNKKHFDEFHLQTIKVIGY
jgi:predicted nucleic acid-binding protein